MLITLLVVFLAPSFTAGAISLEREKQTLDMLVTTPISSLAIVIGKLLSALTYVFILIAASIPVTAVVFVFGGVAPDDVIRGYIVLIATALGLGAFGLFCSSLVKRTQAATVITVFGVIAITLGSVFILYFWNVMAGLNNAGQQGLGPIKGRAPEALAYLNPFLAQADVICGTQTTFDQWCDRYNRLMGGQNGIIFTTEPGVEIPVPEAVPAPAIDFGDNSGGGRFVADVVPFGIARDSFWPKSVAAWLVLSVMMIAVSVQLVSPTRRWRPRLPRREKPDPEPEAPA